ncbi:recombinase family protein [Roseomonas oryzicola]|uniref:Recombinase family protein n=1 Tax=Neoroseomonas oryzicola TaxID=535904 RepID=A0A9X9WJF8_9PROT|nr:recombinase family protein [Neoroseomonas oryzicola]NKE18235.1 recombinase family protein [Neoroseomonas oryzicola]
MSLRVAIYARFSSELQNAGSIEDQVHHCLAYAEGQGWTVVETFTDAAISGATTLRPGYQALLAAMRAGDVDAVLAWSQDRFSRDLEHVAAFDKQARFLGVQMHTVTEGEIDPLKLGVKGIFNAQTLVDIGKHTRRGEAKRVRLGRSFGRVPYGYRMIRRLGPDGEPERGLREPDPITAPVVRRVFEAYCAGRSPRAIARQLNAEGVPGPDGAPWNDATIRGRPKRGDGILRNPIYVGRLVWGRHKKLREPVAGRKVLRMADPENIIECAVPELRIIDEALWEKAQARLMAEAAPVSAESRPAFWERRRPRHLLSEKVVCGCCGRTFTSLGKDYLGCSAARNGHGCRNTRRLRRPQLEAQVLEALAARLMHPELVKRFCASFITAWNKRRAEAAGASAGREQELRAVERKLANLVDAIADGLKAPDLQQKLDELRARRDALQAEIGREMPPAPALHPNIAEVYASQVARLREALDAEGNPAALEAARALIDRVIVSPGDGPDDPPGIELVGRLMQMLQAADAFRPGEVDTASDIVASMSTCSAKEEIGAGSPPPTFTPAPPTPARVRHGHRSATPPARRAVARRGLRPCRPADDGWRDRGPRHPGCGEGGARHRAAARPRAGDGAPSRPAGLRRRARPAGALRLLPPGGTLRTDAARPRPRARPAAAGR